MYENWFGDWFGGWYDLGEGEEEFVDLFGLRSAVDQVIYGSSASGRRRIFVDENEEEEIEILITLQSLYYAIS